MDEEADNEAEVLDAPVEVEETEETMKTRQLDPEHYQSSWVSYLLDALSKAA